MDWEKFKKEQEENLRKLKKQIEKQEKNTKMFSILTMMASCEMAARRYKMMHNFLYIKLGKLEAVLDALFEQAAHEAENKDADALIDVVKDIHEVTTEIRLMREIIGAENE